MGFNSRCFSFFSLVQIAVASTETQISPLTSESVNFTQILSIIGAMAGVVIGSFMTYWFNKKNDGRAHADVQRPEPANLNDEPGISTHLNYIIIF
jgi:hypothetical protein